MSQKGQVVRSNSKHGGKEFNSYFRFIGQVQPTSQFKDGQSVQVPIFEVKMTQSGKPRQVFQCDILTTKHNKLKVERSGIEFAQATIRNSAEKVSQKIAWEDRNDKSKYPNESYHLLDTDWDKAEEFANLVKEGMWVEVRGRYQFDSFINNNNQEVTIVKRVPFSIKPLEEAMKDDKFQNKDYVMDFDSPEFKEVNYFTMQVGIKSTYQDENTKDTKINGVFLDNGKERSEPKDVELMVYYKEPAEGKKALADAFVALNHLDFIEVTGIDNNRPEFSEVEAVVIDEDDPFADVEEVTTRRRSVISGNKRGLEVVSAVKGSRIPNFLTEEEITKSVTIENDDPFAHVELPGEKKIDTSKDDLPFDLD